MESPSTAPTEPPIRIGIVHLLLWTACSGLLLSVNQFFPREQFQTGYGTVHTVSYLLFSLGSGMAVASLPILVYRNLKGWRFPISAGHWLLVLFGLLAIGRLIVNVTWFLIIRLNQESHSPSPLDQFHFYASGSLNFVAATCFALLLFLSIPIRWKIYAVMMAIMLMLSAGMTISLAVQTMSLSGTLLFDLVSLLSTLSMLIRYCFLIPLTVCLVQDIRDPIRYDALHWAGLGLAFYYVAVDIYWQIAYRLLTPTTVNQTAGMFERGVFWS